MAYILLILAITLSFASIAPLIIIPGLVYFGFAQLVYRCVPYLSLTTLHGAVYEVILLLFTCCLSLVHNTTLMAQIYTVLHLRAAI